MFWSRLLSTLLLPPGSLLVLMALGLLLLSRLPRSGRALLTAAALTLYALSASLFGDALARVAQTHAPLRETDIETAAETADAIVLLAAGVAYHAPEYGGASVNTLSLGRARYAALLARRTGLPVLVSGGITSRAPGPPRREAELLKELLEDAFSVGVAMVESRSKNTFENARFSAALLRQRFPQPRVLLVTHAVHMTRAVRAFEHHGVAVIAAPTLFFPIGSEPWSWPAWQPSMRTLTRSRYVLYELLARLWYRVKYY